MVVACVSGVLVDLWLPWHIGFCGVGYFCAGFLAIGGCVAYCGVFVQLLRGVLFVSLGCVVCNVLVGCVSVRR